MIICNLLLIVDATSLHTSAQMVQRWPEELQSCEDVMVLCLIFGSAGSPCASPMKCDQSNVTNRTQGDKMKKFLPFLVLYVAYVTPSLQSSWSSIGMQTERIPCLFDWLCVVHMRFVQRGADKYT